MQRMYVIDLLPSKVGINRVLCRLVGLGHTLSCPAHLFLVDSREIAWSHDSDDCELAGSHDSNG